MMRATCVLLFGFAFAGMSLPLRAGDISAVEDTYTDSAFGKANFGRNGIVAVSPTRTAFIRFDSADIARTPGTIATLNLKVFQVKNWKNGLEIHLVRGPWTERTLTATNSPPISTAVMDSKTIGPMDQGKIVSFDVTDAINVWREDPTQNFGIAIVASSPLPNLQFLSRDLRAGARLTLRSDPVLAIIDIEPILDRHNIAANSLGLAFNPDANLIYLAHGSDPLLGVIYTLDTKGTLLHELDFQSTYRPYAWPESLQYDRRSGHLLVLSVFGRDPSNPFNGPAETRLVEIDPHSGHVFSDVLIPDMDGGGGVLVRDDGIWQARFGEDIIRHYTRAGVFINDVSVAASFPGFLGPDALTSSFVGGGFFIADLFGERIVEVSMAGREVAAASTANLGDGRGFAMASDSNTERIFLQVNNKDIYILSSRFIR